MGFRPRATFPGTDQKAVIIVSNYVNTQYPSDYILPLTTLKPNKNMSFNLFRNRLSIHGLKHGHLNHQSKIVVVASKTLKNKNIETVTYSK